MPHGITQCYLPPGRGDIPALTPAEAGTRVGFVAAAVSMPMGGCRARRPGGGRSLVSAETVDVVMAAALAVL